MNELTSPESPASWERVTQLDLYGEQETSMRISQICAVAVLLVVASVMAFGDGINDPKIIIRNFNSNSNANPDLSCPSQGCKDVGVNFTFSVPKRGTGILFFTNTSGKNWTSLALIEKGEPAIDITCVQVVFLNCTTKTLKNGSVEILLSGVHCGLNPRNGILNGQSFYINFAKVNGVPWPGGLQFSAHAGTVPEPGTVALMMTGLAAMVSRRKMWKIRPKA
jgi:hypothetical protein